MKKWKRAWVLILVFVMLCTMLPEIPYAAALPEDVPKEEKQENLDPTVTEIEPQMELDAVDSSIPRGGGNWTDTEQIETVEADPGMPDSQKARAGKTVDETGSAVDDYTLLTVGNPLSRTGAASSEIFAFHTDTAGWYHLKVESTGEMRINAARSYIENDEETLSGWYGYGYNRKVYDKVFYCVSSDTYLFDIYPSNGQAEDYTVSVDTAEISSVEAIGEWGSAYPGAGFDYSGMQLKLMYADGTSTITDVAAYGYVEAFENSSLGGNVYFGQSIQIEYFTKKDSSVPEEQYSSLSGLENGVYTAHAYVVQYENGEGKNFEFSFDVVVEQDVVESITVVSAEKTEFTKGFSEYLGDGKVTIQVNYKDGRAPKQVSSQTENSGLSLYLEHNGNLYGAIEDYLRRGGALGEAAAHVSYRGVETTYPITISDNPYSRMEIELRDTVYYADCGYTFGDSTNGGENLDPWNIVKKATLYYKDSGREPETYSHWVNLPNAYRYNYNSGLLLEQSTRSARSTELPEATEMESSAALDSNSYEYLYRNVDSFLAAGGKLGKNIYRVNWAGITADMEVEICANPYSKVEVLTPPSRSTYRTGNIWDFLRTDGMILRAYYADNPTEYTDVAIPDRKVESVEQNRIFRHLDTRLGGHEEIRYLETGTHKVSVFYYGHPAEFYIEVVKNPISNFKVKLAHTEYLAGYETRISPYELKLSFQLEKQVYTDLVYDSEKYQELYQKYYEEIKIDETKVNFNKAGTYPVKISYMGATAECLVTVVDRIVKSFEITESPSKTSYYAGETGSISLDGLELEVTGLDDKKVKYKAYYYEQEEYGSWNDLAYYEYKLDTSAVKYDTPGIYEVVFHYGGASDTFLVEIVESPVASLEIKQMPEKKSYYEFESFNFNGLHLIVHYKDGTDYTVVITGLESGIQIPYQSENYNVQISWKNWNDEDDNAIVLSYLGVRAEISAKCERNPITGIRVTKNPECMTYLPNSSVSVDLYGAEFEISYLDGFTKRVAISEHVSETVEEKYGIRLSSYFADWDNCIRVNIAGSYVSIPVESFDFAETDPKDLTEDQNQSGTIGKDQSYQIFKFVPKETKPYTFFCIMGYDKANGGIFDASGREMDYDIAWSSGNYCVKKSNLTANETYYFVIQKVKPGKEDFYLCGISSTKDMDFRLEADIDKFEVTKAPKTRFYTFEENLYESDVPVDNLEYRITCEDGTVLCGRVNEFRAFGLSVWGRFKNVTENGMADTSKENAIQYWISSRNADGSTKAETEVPVTFDAVSPVASITLNQSPWTTVLHHEGYDALRRTRGLVLTIHYADGTSKTVAMQGDDGTWIADSYPYRLELEWKNKYSSGRPKVGDNAIVISYMGSSVETPVTVERNLIPSDFKVKPPHTKYLMGYETRIDPSGMKLSFQLGDQVYTDLTYDSWEYEALCRSYGEEIEIDETKVNFNKTGTYPVTVSYMGASAEYSVAVVDKVAKSLKIISVPRTTTYYTDKIDEDRISLDGLKLEVTGLDGKKTKYKAYYGQREGYESWWDLVNERYYKLDISAVKYDTPGTYEVVFRYGGVSDTFPIKIEEYPVASLEIKQMPEKKSYYKFESNSINLKGLQLTVHYKDGTDYTAVVTESNSYIEIPYQSKCYTAYASWKNADDGDEQSYRDNAIVLSYMGVKAEIPAKIEKNPITGIRVTKNPECMAYLFGYSRVDLYGAEFEISYLDGSKKTMAVSEHVSEAAEERYGIRLSSDFEYWDNSIQINIAQQSTSISLKQFDFAKADLKNIIEDQQQSGVIGKDQSYQIFKFVPKETKKYTFFCTMGYGCPDVMIFNASGERMNDDYYYDYDLYYYSWHGELTANNTYYFAVRGKENSYLCIISSTGWSTSLKKDIAKFEVIKAPKTKFYTFEKINVEIDNLEYRITCKDGTVLCGRIENEEDYPYALGLHLKGRFKYATEDGTADTARENAICYQIGGWRDGEYEVKAETEVPVTFEASPVASITLNKSPWTTVSQYDYYDELRWTKGLSLTIHYTDGTSKDVTMQEDSTWIEDSYPSNRLELEWKETDSSRMPKVGDNAIIISYMGSSTEAPVKVEGDLDPDQSTEEPATEEPATEAPPAKEPATEIPPAKEPSTEEPTTEELSTAESETEALSTEEPSTAESETEALSTEEPSTAESETETLSTEEPSTAEPATETPTTEEPETEEMPTEELPAPELPAITELAEAAITIDIPKAGEELPKAEGEEGYTVDVTWTDAEKGQAAEFARAYRAKILLTPKQNYIFTEHTAVRLNGRKTAARIFSKQNGTITILYTFPYTDCSVTVPKVKGYTLDESANEAEGRVPYGKNYVFRYEKTDQSTDPLVVKADGKTLKPDQNGTYTLTEIKSNMVVTAKSMSAEAKKEFARLDFYNRETLSDSYLAEKNKTVAVSGEEDALPVLESYADGSKDFFFGWYRDRDDSLNGIGKRFCSTTPVPEQDVLPLYAKWGLGIFSCIYNTKLVNYKVLSIDESNRMKVQVGDGSSPAIKDGKDAKSVDAVGIEAVGDDGTFVIPAFITDFKGTGLDKLGIEFAGCSVTAIAENAFKGAEDIKKISLPDTITEIGAGAFGGCTNLEGIEIPSSVKQMKSGTFSGCTSLKNVVLSDGITAIDGNVFEGCTSLEMVVIPDSVQKIDAEAFADAGSSGLKLVCGSSVSEIVKEAAEAVGATVQNVDVSFEGASGDKKFTYGDKPLTITAGVAVDGSRDQNRTAGVKWQVEEGMEQYYQVTVKANQLTVEPKEATDGKTYRILAKDASSGQTKGLAFSTAAASLEAAVKAEEIPAASYTGKPIEPEVILTLIQSGKRLVQGVDYEVTYQNNTEAGKKAAAIITGIHNYSGKITKYFTIQQGFETGNAKRVESIALNYESLTLQLHSRKSLAAKILPLDADNQAITWKSSDDSVVAVEEDGMVEAMANGMAVITAEADGKTASCEVIVPYGISYKLNGGKNHESNPYVYYSDTIKLKNPSKKGCIFGGWYTDRSMKNKVAAINANAGRDYVLHAKWIKISLGKPALTSVKNAKPQKASVRFKKVKGAEGYETAYSIHKKFKKSQTKVKMQKKTNTELTRLTKGKIYYVKVRAFQVDSTGKKVYGKWSSPGRVRITK